MLKSRAAYLSAVFFIFFFFVPTTLLKLNSTMKHELCMVTKQKIQIVHKIKNAMHIEAAETKEKKHSESFSLCWHKAFPALHSKWIFYKLTQTQWNL